jgi:hypothetical protein
METERLPYRLELPMADPVRVGDLPSLMAGAMHQDEFSRVAAEGGIWRELRSMVDAGTLQPLNALTMAPHDFPVGDALRRAVVLPYGLRPLLKAKGIDLHLIEPGNGPKLWCLRNAARDIGEIQGWSMRQAETLCEQMLDAARDGVLVVRNPHTDLPVPLHKRATVSDFSELVTRDDVNEWLVSLGAPYRWVTYEQAAAEPRLIGGRRLWKLADAVEFVTTIEGFGVSRDGLLRRAVAAASARPCRLLLTDPEPAHPSQEHPGDALSGFLGDGVFADDFNSWLASIGFRSQYRLRDDPPSQPNQTGPLATAEPAPTVVAAGETVRVSGDEWKRQAREVALAIVKREAARDWYPPQSRIADEVAADLRKRGIFGADGKPLTGATIKRHALKGISSAVKKSQSTKMGRGK